MSRREDHYNRYGEVDVRPGHFRQAGGIGSLYTGQSNSNQISMPSFQDEYGMNRVKEPSQADQHFGKGPKNWPDDNRIKERVSETLYLNRDVDASGIEILVKDGFVTLRGEVMDREQKKYAERCVENLPGIVDIRNELTFKI